MKGMSATTGKALEGTDHLEQSIQDILTTPIGSRVMRREYGSRLFELVDRPVNPGWLLDAYAYTADALEVRVTKLEGTVAYLESLHQVLRGVTFHTGSAKITDAGKTVLRVVANALKRRPVNVEIGGYASKTGTEAFNMRLSQRRAEAVRDFLIANGVSADRLTANGYGWSNPVAPNDTAEGRRANQRVELKAVD